VTGAKGDAYLKEGQWEGSIDYRFLRSSRHFVGDREETNKALDESQSINEVHQLNVSVSYAIVRRLSLAVSLPFIFASRSVPVLDPSSNAVVDHSVTHSRGLGDISVTARTWLLDPDEHPRGNVFIGVGLKLPTGDAHVIDGRRRYVDGKIAADVAPVDQSIQLGDGGLGGILELNAFQRFGDFGLYLAGFYLFNPQNKSGTLTFRPRASEAEMSVSDAYLGRLGLSYGIALPWKGQGLGLSAGARMEGVPVKDVFGSSDGFRRPGFAFSIEPGISYAVQGNAFSVYVPVALYRNRQKSLPEQQDDQIGDAAFADWLLLLHASRRF
jgi:hypothetical protein